MLAQGWFVITALLMSGLAWGQEAGEPALSSLPPTPPVAAPPPTDAEARDVVQPDGGVVGSYISGDVPQDSSTSAYAPSPSAPPAHAEATFETVVRYDAERPVTGWHISGRELQRRGADTLADALDLLAHIQVRLGGRGEWRFNLRGASPGSIRVLVDGVPMEEPYLGRFDPASISVLDVVEIHVDAAPLSPLDGPGGEGGVVEVTTLSASGSRLLEGRGEVGYPLLGSATGTVRLPFDNGGVRLSATLNASRNFFELTKPDKTLVTFPANAALAQVGGRVEEVLGGVHLSADVGLNDRCFWVPPSENVLNLQHICAQDSARGIVRAKYERGPWRLTGAAYTLVLGQHSIVYGDPLDPGSGTQLENVSAHRLGGNVHLERLLGDHFRLMASTTVEGTTADYDLGTLTNPAHSFGHDFVVEPAAGAVFESARVRAEASVGAAIPTLPVTPAWPEAKGTVVARSPYDIVFTGNVGRKGRLPSLRERYEALDGNPALGPELQTYVDLGVHRQYRWFSPQAAVFKRWIDGLIQLSIPGSHGTGVQSMLINKGRIEAEGFELSFAVNAPGMFGGGGSYGYVYTTKEVENQPAYHAEAYFKFQIPKAGALTRVRYIGQRAQAGILLDAYELWDASAWYQISRNYRVTLRCDDILDTHYQYRQNFLSSGRFIGASFDATFD